MVKHPPPFALSPTLYAELAPYLTRYQAVDDKGRYLHWDELRWRLPREEAVRAWCAVKIKRQLQLKDTGLFAENGQPMRFWLPDTAQAILLGLEQLDNRLRETAREQGGNRYLVRSLMMEEAISSAQLEGAATTRAVAKVMLETERAPRNDDERMVVNNFVLMKLAKINKNEPLSVDFIQYLQEAAVKGIEKDSATAGEIRQNNQIVVSGRMGDVLHQPPDYRLLPARLERLCQFANTAHDGRGGMPFIHPVVKAIVLHFMLCYEHPFTDGNGRTARALFYWYMLKAGYWGFEYISISALLRKAPAQYANAYLFVETDDFDLTYFIDYQLGILDRAVQGFMEYLSRKQREYLEQMGVLEKTGILSRLNVRQARLLQKIVSNPGRVFTVNEVKNDFDVSLAAARADLDKLVGLKALVKFKEGRTACYVSRQQDASLANPPNYLD